ncbi:MAG: hypothetical protein RL681_228 [Candidatus Parcubacteria bacterium]|jgi:hypothetical protein
MSWYHTISKRTYALAFFGILIVFAGTLFAMGRLPICECGYVKLWQNDVMSAENSQHIADWYTFSHIIHGFLFFWLLWWVSRKFFAKSEGPSQAESRGLPLGIRFLSAVLFEVAWEIIENSPWVIAYYRANTVSLGYVGDSILNSVFDVVWMSLGFLLARKFPIWVTITLAVLMELVAAYVIRDNLTLNILMFIYPFPALKAWQTGL